MSDSRNRRICKVKIGKDDYDRECVTIKMEEPDMTGGYTSHLIECKDAPHPDLRNALKAMSEYLLEHAEFPSTWTVAVIGVTITHTNEVQGLVITGRRDLENCNAPLIINTPHYTRESYNEDDGSDIGIFSSSCGDALDLLEQEAIAYVDGKRSQGELDFDEEKAGGDTLDSLEGSEEQGEAAAPPEPGVIINFPSAESVTAAAT
jgi:hypothetical protein